MNYNTIFGYIRQEIFEKKEKKLYKVCNIVYTLFHKQKESLHHT